MNKTELERLQLELTRVQLGLSSVKECLPSLESKSLQNQIESLQVKFNKLCLPVNLQIDTSSTEGFWEDYEERSGITFRDIVEAFLIEEKEELEDNGDIPEWVSNNMIVLFASENKKFSYHLKAVQEAKYQRATFEAILEEILNFENTEN